MSPLTFTDEELDSVNALASSMPPVTRDHFLRLVAAKLAAYPVQARGVGLAHRVGAEVQREFVHLAVGSVGKYGRVRSGR